jgi:hypothetical protein
MATTFTLIASSTVGSGGAANIEFTSIPATYTDLVLKLSARRTTGSFPDGSIQFNNDTASNYLWRNVYGSGSAAGSNDGGTTTSIAIALTGSSETANTFTNSEFYIPNYAGSTQKSVSIDSVTENNATTAYMSLLAGLWTGTVAITSIKIIIATALFEQYSTAYLYGIKNS